MFDWIQSIHGIKWMRLSKSQDIPMVAFWTINWWYVPEQNEMATTKLDMAESFTHFLFIAIIFGTFFQKETFLWPISYCFTDRSFMTIQVSKQEFLKWAGEANQTEIVETILAAK